jgi:hypothetical protein
MELDKNMLILSFFVLVVFCVLLFVIILSLSQKNNPTNNTIGPFPEITKVPVSAKPAIKNNGVSEQKLIDKMENPTPLVSSDQQAKDAILSPLGGKSGDLYSSPNVIISYISSAKIFQGNILTVNVDQAKQEAVSWFQKQGMSQTGICNLPLEFYLNWDIANDPQLNNTVFDTLPPGC